jgi:hypothetical protein
VVIMFTDEDKQHFVCTAGSKADDKRSCNVVFGRIGEESVSTESPECRVLTE